MGRKHLETTYSAKYQYPEYIKEPENSVIKNKQTNKTKKVTELSNQKMGKGHEQTLN